MPHVVACAANTNDVLHALCNMHAPASQPFLSNYDAPENTYTPVIHVSQSTSTKINCITFLLLK